MVPPCGGITQRTTILSHFLPTARHAAVALLCAAAPWAQAQLIDEVDVRREGDDAVLSVRFVTPVRYTRSVAPRANDLAQVYYEVVEPRGVASLLTAGQRRLAGGDGLPTIAITDEFDGPAASVKRKLVVRFGSQTRFKVRSGRTTRSIDIVLEGQGGAVKPRVAAPPMPAAAPGRQFVVLLSSSVDPGMQLNAPVPASLQECQIVTSRRVVDGRTLYEVSLGYFGLEAEALRAQAMLKPRFPQAAVVALATPAATPIAPVPPVASAPASAAALPASEAAGAAVDFDAQGGDLLARAKAAQAAGNTLLAIETLNKLLNLPPNRNTREGQELVGRVRLQAGDPDRARSEFETFLRLYPQGADSDRVRAELARLPAPAVASAAAVRPQATTSTSGSVGVTYYGGKSKTRTQEFQDSPISGLPELVNDATISGTDQKQMLVSTDLNWRQRDADQETRFVFRDNYTADLMPGKGNRNRLSALYVDYKSMLRGTQVRLGRQTPLGGGVLGRFDGVTAGYLFAPRWKANIVAGSPSDKLNATTRRRFWGLSVDAEALSAHSSGSLYVIQQTIDGLVDRRAVGSDLRYFNGGLAVTGTVDYDVVMKGLNVATVQGNWQLADTSNWNFLYDRRAQPLLSLGNALFFADPTLGVAKSVAELVARYAGKGGITQARQDVSDVTARSTQAQLGYTTPISKNWQVGSSVQLTNVSAVDPVPSVGFAGQAATGNQWSLSGQLIGSNLYSLRDTHVFNLSLLSAPTLKGQLLMYNNLSALNDSWQIEPSFQIYLQRTSEGIKLRRYKPGMRVTYRMAQQLQLESSVDYELSRQSGGTTAENSGRVFYYVGGRYDF